MLSPKKVKWRKPQKGNMRGMSNTGNYVSFGNFDDALKITKLLSENQDEAGCFIFSDTIENLNKYLLPQKILSKIHAVRWFKIDEILGNISRVFQL